MKHSSHDHVAFCPECKGFVSWAASTPTCIGAILANWRDRKLQAVRLTRTEASRLWGKAEQQEREWGHIGACSLKPKQEPQPQ